MRWGPKRPLAGTQFEATLSLGPGLGNCAEDARDSSPGPLLDRPINSGAQSSVADRERQVEMSRVRPVSVLSRCDGRCRPPVTFSPLLRIREEPQDPRLPREGGTTSLGDKGSLMSREASDVHEIEELGSGFPGERKRERAERDYGGLSKQEREQVGSRNPGFLPESREGAQDDLGGRQGLSVGAARLLAAGPSWEAS
jgi:hypothetical protein